MLGYAIPCEAAEAPEIRLSPGGHYPHVSQGGVPWRYYASDSDSDRSISSNHDRSRHKGLYVCALCALWYFLDEAVNVCTSFSQLAAPLSFSTQPACRSCSSLGPLRLKFSLSLQEVLSRYW